MKKTGKTVKVCPRCHSPRIRPHMPTKIHGMGILPGLYRCNDCGLVAKFYIELPEEEVRKHGKDA